jgi:hypothetical protein
MQSFQVRSKPVGENSFPHAGLLPAGVTIRPGCSICQGPLMLAATLAITRLQMAGTSQARKPANLPRLA